MLRKTYTIRVAQYKVTKSPRLPFIGMPTHYGIQLVNRQGQVLDEINFGSQRRGSPQVDFTGAPWANNRLSFVRKVMKHREAYNHPGARSFTRPMALGLFEAIASFASDIDKADLDYFFAGSFPFKQRVGNSNSAAAAVAKLIGLNVADLQSCAGLAPIGASADIFAALGKDIAKLDHYRRLAVEKAQRIYQAPAAYMPIEAAHIDRARDPGPYQRLFGAWDFCPSGSTTGARQAA